MMQRLYCALIAALMATGVAASGVAYYGYYLQYKSENYSCDIMRITFTNGWSFLSFTRELSDVNRFPYGAWSSGLITPVSGGASVTHRLSIITNGTLKCESTGMTYEGIPFVAVVTGSFSFVTSTQVVLNVESSIRGPSWMRHKTPTDIPAKTPNERKPEHDGAPNPHSPSTQGAGGR